MTWGSSNYVIVLIGLIVLYKDNKNIFDGSTPIIVLNLLNLLNLYPTAEQI